MWGKYRHYWNRLTLKRITITIRLIEIEIELTLKWLAAKEMEILRNENATGDWGNVF